MDSRDWFFEQTNPDSHLPATDDMFTLPANISNSSLWNNFSDGPLNLDGLQSFPHIHDPVLTTLQQQHHHHQHHHQQQQQQQQQQLQTQEKTEDDVSDVTDAQLTNSPQTKPHDLVGRSPGTLLPHHNDLGHNSGVDSRLRPTKSLSKHARRSFMPALFLGQGRAVVRKGSGSQVVAEEASGKLEKQSTQKRPADDSSRQRHNQMMRENRGRFNRKFKELTQLLESLKSPGDQDKPMKNKIQTLERAMYQYALMESQRATFKNKLLFSSGGEQCVRSDEMDVMASAPTVQDACDIVVRNMCACLDWKYGEVWSRDSVDDVGSGSHSNMFTLSSAFVSPKNMPATRRALEKFAMKGKKDKMDGLLLRMGQLRHGVWVCDLSRKQNMSMRAQEAVSAGVSTMLMIPITVNSMGCGRPDAIIAVMHADDELMNFPGRVRPYDSESVCRLTELASAVVQTRSNSP